MMKKITSKAYTHSLESDYVRDRYELLRLMGYLVIISDIKMWFDNNLNDKTIWAFTKDDREIISLTSGSGKAPAGTINSFQQVTDAN